jgi:vancomycin resistance protein VanW
LSGGIYHLSLTAGLRILERHAHSVDIYDDATRYTPLGADATVAYGFKDLRIENTLPAPICFRIAIGSDDMTFAICSVSAIPPCQIEFTRTRQTDGTSTVETLRRGPEQVASERVAISTYRVRSNPIKPSQSTPQNL